MKPLFGKPDPHLTETTEVSNMKKKSALIFLFVIIAAILFNTMFESVPLKYSKIDLTKQSLYSLSPQSIQILNSLENPIEIYLIAQTGKEDNALMHLLARYKDTSENIRIATVDPIVNPSFVGKYTNLQADNNSIVIVSGARSQYIALSQIYVTDYEDYLTTGTASTKFDGEGVITSAIDFITSDYIPKLYQLQGHGETLLSSTLQYAISKQNIVLESINLLTSGNVPEDADCLLILAPTVDISIDEKTILENYLNHGGNLLLCTDVSDVETPYLSEIMFNYGLQKVPGIIIEADATRFLHEYPHFLLPEIMDHEITGPIKNAGFQPLLPVAHGIVVTADHRQDLRITNLLNTSKSAYAKPEGYQMTTAQRQESDIQGPFVLAAAVEGRREISTRLAWISTSQMLQEDINTLVSGANHNLFINTVGWLCRRPSVVSVHAKILKPPYLTVPSLDSALWSILMVFVIPIMVMLYGVLVLRKRKKR